MTGAPQTAPAGRSDTVACPGCQRRNRIRATAIGVPRCAACGSALPWLTAADDGDFTDVVEAATLPVLVDVWARWCGPCRIVLPGVERAALTFAGRLKVVQVDIDEAPRVAGRYHIRSIPTLLVVTGGREAARQVGAVPPAALLDWLRETVEAPA